MKRFSLGYTCACLGAALSFGASGASAQTPVPSPPAASPTAPFLGRTAPLPGAPTSPTSPLFGIEPMPRMEPLPGMGPMPNGATSPRQPSPRMAPMPGVTPRTVPDVTLRRDLELRYYTPLVSASPLASPRPDTMIVDGDFLYILRDDTLIKMDKKSLTIVGTTTLGATILPIIQFPASGAPKSNRATPAPRIEFGIGPKF